MLISKSVCRQTATKVFLLRSLFSLHYAEKPLSRSNEISRYHSVRSAKRSVQRTRRVYARASDTNPKRESFIRDKYFLVQIYSRVKVFSFGIPATVKFRCTNFGKGIVGALKLFNVYCQRDTSEIRSTRSILSDFDERGVKPGREYRGVVCITGQSLYFS